MDPAKEKIVLTDSLRVKELRQRNEELEKLVAEKTDKLLQMSRDLEIEASLERIRARSMAMHNSSELVDASDVFFQQLKDLGIASIRTGVAIFDEQNENIEVWSRAYTGEHSENKIRGVVPKDSHPFFEKCFDAWKRKEKYFSYELKGKEVKKYYDSMASILSYPEKKNHNPQEYFYIFFFPEGSLNVVRHETLNEEEINILQRFARVFGLMYRRFLDLQNAEEQTREAKIEAALEKVRGRAMAMHNSSDLTDAAGMVFTELNNLGIKPIRSGFVLLTNKSRVAKLYPATSFDSRDTVSFTGEFEFTGHPVYEKQYLSWQKKENYFPVLEGEILESYYKILGKGLSVPYENLRTTNRKQFGTFLPFTEGFLFAWSNEPYNEKEINILARFKVILDLTIRRYIDLKNAEAQARESQIEAALERVRSKAMAMQKSDDLAAAVAIVFEELDKLNLGMMRCGIGIIDKDKRSADVWTTTKSDNESRVHVSGDESMDIHPLLQGAYDAWLRQGDFSYVLQGEDLNKYYLALTQVNFKLPDSESIVSETEGLMQYYYVTSFQSGGLFAFRELPFPEEAKIVMKRFADVFNLTYTRFNDLKQAELQTHKAHIEVALERVRARALAMQEPEELVQVAQVFRHEMGLLGIKDLEAGIIFTQIDSLDKADCWFAVKDLRKNENNIVADHIKLTLDQTWVGREMLRFYDSDENEISILMKDEHRKEWIDYCYSLSGMLNNFYGEDIPDRTYHLFKFSNGSVGAVSPGNLSEESWDVLKRAASVFSLAYSRFKDLTQARIDLRNLKEEKKRSDSLLLNILPEEIANELKQFGKSYARKHEQVTILFADIKGFSSIAESLSANDLVAQLDECFRAFDNIVEKHALEKIKTIGDAYVCACGLPLPVDDNAIKAVRAALDMTGFVKGFGVTKSIQNLPVFEFRIGIHTGPVVTGVVGLKKFTYDIWGDAVNMAARMEQHGEAGKINISGYTYQLIKDKFNCSYRGKIEVKNKGEMDMYFVKSAI